MAKKRASKMLTERELRKIFERDFQKIAMIDTDRIGRGGRPSGPYFRFLEDTVRTYWPELKAMIARENRLTIQRHDLRTAQTTIFNAGMENAHDQKR